MTIPVFYVPKQSVRTDSFSPSSRKPELVVRDWAKRKLGIEVRAFEHLYRSEIATAHDPAFVHDVIEGLKPNGFGNTDIGLSWSCAYTTGSMVAAARHVAIELKKGRVTAACSPTSGFHHAGWDYAGGYCTFNGLMIAALSVIASGHVQKVAILDYDHHYGDGTANIIATLGLQQKVFHFSAGGIYSGPESAPGMLRTIPTVVKRASDFGAEMVLYQAGADQHVDDPIGGVLTTAGLAMRDRLIFAECKRLQLPVAWNLAGGYQTDKRGGIPKVLTIHRNTMRECIKTFGATQ